MHHQRVDASPLTTLAVCTCGWRDLADDRLHARELIHVHVLAVHPQQQERTRRALNALRKDTA